MRLDKMLVTLGIGTRTAIQKIIRARRVTVNGRIISNPSEHISGTDRICLDDDLIDTRTSRHLMMNKPAGILTAAADRRQKTVLDLLPPLFKACGCMPVGRLDKDTEGLLLLTTDGQLAHRLLSPRRKVWKVYEADVDGPLDEGDVAAFRQGIGLSDFTTQPAELTIMSSSLQAGKAHVQVCEGKFHQVKRMFIARGRHVTHLKRLSFGPIALDNALKPGGYRELTAIEHALLVSAVAGDADA